MPKVYQASYKENDKSWRTTMASRASILAEARDAAKEHGVKVLVEELEIDKPSFKYFIECMNGRQANSRKIICAFVPRESITIEDETGTPVKQWKVKKVSK